MFQGSDLLSLLGQTSFAQERIFVDEHMRYRFQSDPIYVIRMTYRISSTITTTLSIE